MRIRLKYNIITQWAEMSFGTHGDCTVVASLQPPVYYYYNGESV